MWVSGQPTRDLSYDRSKRVAGTRWNRGSARIGTPAVRSRRLLPRSVGAIRRRGRYAFGRSGQSARTDLTKAPST
jgi:hypothetical protein